MNCGINNNEAGDTIMTACLEYQEYTMSIFLKLLHVSCNSEDHHPKLHTERTELLWHI